LSDDGDLVEDDEAAAPRAKKQQRGLGGLAMRELRRAHKLFNEGDSSAAEAHFLVSSANVLATLDLAAAIRETQGGGGAVD
jgi:hypothetical protein